MIASLVVRLLDADKALLAWTKIQAMARGDGCLYAIEPSMTLMVTTPGTPAWLSYHWADLHLETRVPLMSAPVGAGMPVVLQLPADALWKLGDSPTDLPSVTVGTAVITVPTGRG